MEDLESSNITDKGLRDPSKHVSSGDTVFFFLFSLVKMNSHIPIIYFYLVISYHDGKFDIFPPSLGDFWTSVSNTPSSNLITFYIVNFTILI